MPMMVATVRVLAETRPEAREANPEIGSHEVFITMQLDSAQLLPGTGEHMVLNDWVKRHSYNFKVERVEHVWNIRHEAPPVILLFAKDMNVVNIPTDVLSPHKRIIMPRP